MNGQTLGRSVPLNTLPACEGLVPELVLPGVPGVGLAALRMPLVNCVDGSGEAVSLYATFSSSRLSAASATCSVRG